MDEFNQIYDPKSLKIGEFKSKMMQNRNRWFCVSHFYDAILMSDFESDGFCHSKLLKSNLESSMSRFGMANPLSFLFGASLVIVRSVSAKNGKQ